MVIILCGPQGNLKTIKALSSIMAEYFLISLLRDNHSFKNFRPINFIQYSQHSSYRWGNWGSVTYSGSHSEEVTELWCIPRQSVLSFLLSRWHMKDWGLGSPRLVMHLGCHQLTVTPSPPSPHPLPRSGVPSGLNWKTMLFQPLLSESEARLDPGWANPALPENLELVLKEMQSPQWHWNMSNREAWAPIFSADRASLQERGGWGYAERGRETVSPWAPSGFHFLVLVLPDAKSGL